MSVRNGFVLLLALSTLALLVGCGSGGTSVTVGTAPPSGAFSKSSLNGTYVFSISGSDENGASYSVVGALIANGNGGITGGTIDMNDAEFAGNSVSPLIAYSINNNGFYSVGDDGRGQATLGLNANPLGGSCSSNGNIVLDFVLQDTSHGLVTEFDCMATGSGTLDAQTASVTPSGSYAFSLSGAVSGTTSALAAVGNFTLSGSSITTGLADFNSAGAAFTNSDAGYPVTGTIVAGPSASNLSTLTTGAPFGTEGALTFDVYPIDATHLKFIEVDSYADLVGDAFTESTTFPSGTLAFTAAGLDSGAPAALGGYMISSGSGSITSGTEDYNLNGTSVSSTSVPFSGSYSGSAGRYSISLTSFYQGTGFVAYPSSAGTLLLQDDDIGGTTGVLFPAQTAGASFTTSQGYGLNFTGANVSDGVEIDDIAEFTADASGSTCTAGSTSVSSDTLIGVADENYTDASTSQIYGQALCGQFASPDSNGRFPISVATNNLLGGYTLTAYTVDGTTFPFIESDSGQVSTGVLILQNSSQSAIAKSRAMFIPHPMARPNSAKKKRSAK